MKTQPKPLILKTCRDLLLKAGFKPSDSGWDGEDAMEKDEGDIRCLLRETPNNSWEEKRGTYLMIQIFIRDPSLKGTGNPLEWPGVLDAYLKQRGVVAGDNSNVLVFYESDAAVAREKVEKVLLPWVATVANMEWLRMHYEKLVEQLKPQRKFFGLIEKRVKERPIYHHYLSLLRWHCGDRQGAIEEAKRYLELLPDNEESVRWYKWLTQPGNQSR